MPIGAARRSSAVGAVSIVVVVEEERAGVGASDGVDEVVAAAVVAMGSQSLDQGGRISSSSSFRNIQASIASPIDFAWH